MAQMIDQLRKNKKSMGVYKSLKERTEEVVAYIAANGPAGCVSLSQHFKCSRVTIHGVLAANTGTLLKKVREGGHGVYGQEALFDLLTEEETDNLVKTPDNPPWWPPANQALVTAMRNMMFVKPTEEEHERLHV